MFLLCTLNRTTFFIQVALFPLQHAKRSVNRFCLNTAPLPSLRRTHHAQVNKCHANLRTSNKIHIYTANFALKNNFNMPSIKKNNLWSYLSFPWFHTEPETALAAYDDNSMCVSCSVTASTIKLYK